MTPNGISSPRVACVVVTYNRDDFITTCVSSLLREDGEQLRIEVTVINNGATDGTAGVLAGIDDPRVTIRTNAVNQPLAGVLNTGLEIGLASGADYILLLNDDIEMQPGAIAEMVAVCRDVPQSIVTPLQINYRRPGEIDGGMRELLLKTPALLDDTILQGEPQRYYRQHTLIGAALLAEAGTYRAVGDFDPIFPFYGLDDDYSNRAREMGIPLLAAMRARMLHLHGKTEAGPEISKEDWLRRWSTHYRARMIFRLKTPGRSFPALYAGVLLQVVLDIPGFLLKRFPGGSKTAAQTLMFLLGHGGQIARRRETEQKRLAEFRAAADT